MNITYKGASAFYTDQGKGQTILLLHGFLENHKMWSPFLDRLSSNYRVICVDLLGHGNSDCTGYVHTMEEMAGAVYAIVTKLGLNDVQLIGHSMGGYVGIAFAKAYPQKLLSICLLNSTPQEDDISRKKLRLRANKMAKTQYNQLIRMSILNLFNPAVAQSHALEIDKSLHEALQTSVQGYIAANTGMLDRAENTDFWINLKVKKGIILGNKDSIINCEEQADAFSKHTNFFKILEGGHMLHISNENQVEKALLDFLLIKN